MNMHIDVEFESVVRVFLHSYRFFSVTQGNAIEGRIESMRSKIDSKIFIYRCYVVDGYMVDPLLRFGQVVPATTTMIIGDMAVFRDEAETTIPTQYFSFVSYLDLEDMFNQTELLTEPNPRQGEDL